jgi:predicted ATPase
MLALYRAGRQSEALRSYKQMRELLLDELGVDPSPELRDLEQRILEQDDSLLLTAERSTSVRAAREVLSTLPVPATSLLGRQDEIGRTRAMLSDHRLVTLTGVGGCGKTRLAIAVAERELPTLEHGAYFADLSVVSTDDDVVLAVADAVRFRIGGGGDPRPRLLEHLADKQALVVLDNCEHVIGACAEFADAVLGQRGEWRMLATSREHLDVDGEQVLQVPSLSVDGDGAAVGLFEARALELNADFIFDDANRAIVGELCERLDGMPLAIELAAARSAVMSPTELLDRIDDRFRVLSPARRRSRQRRRTLEATLDWSYDLLDADEQHMFTTLGVFRGPFGVAATAAVAQVDVDVAIDLLESLIAKSLVVTANESGTTLFRLLETVRAYAEEHLKRNGALEAARDRHLEHHLVAVGSAGDERWLELKPNFEAAIDRAIALDRHSDAVELLDAAGSLWHEDVSAQPTLDRLDIVAAALPQDSPLRERLRIPEMALALSLGDVRRRAIAAAAAAQASNDETRVAGLMDLANTSTMTDPDESLRLVEEARAIAVFDGIYHAYADKIKADVHMFAGEYENALALLQPHAGSGWALMDASIAAVLLLDGRPSQALEMADGFSVMMGLCQLALDQHEIAERELMAEARSAALGREPLASNGALVGLAALVNHDGNVQWATDLIFGAVSQRMLVMNALARMVAEQIGVRDELVPRQEAATTTDVEDATVLLRETLARWDTQEAKPQTAR